VHVKMNIVKKSMMKFSWLKLYECGTSSVYMKKTKCKCKTLQWFPKVVGHSKNRSQKLRN